MLSVFPRRASISQAFLLFSVIIIIAVVLVSFGFWVDVYDVEMNKKRDQLPTEANRVESLLIDSIDYTAKYAEYIGERLVQRNVHDLKAVASVIMGKQDSESGEQKLYTTTFDWVTPDKQLRISSKTGILSEPYDMSERDYLARTPKLPWTLQLSKPRYGGISREWIIPAGMGLSDREGDFLGTITWGVSIPALTRRLAQVMGPGDVRYLILTPDNELLLDSAAENTGPHMEFGIDEAHRKEFPSNGAQFLNKPVQYQGVNYTYYKKVHKYPFAILAGYNSGLANSIFNQVVLSRVVGFLGVGVAALAMLYWIRRRLVKPVMELAQKADSISRGREVNITEHSIHEIDLLGEQLQKISNYMQNERRIRNELAQKTDELELAYDAALKANRAKSEFLANMSHELRTPMNAVIGLTNIMMSQSPTPEKQKEYLSVMQVSALHLMQLINDLLDLSKLEAGQLEVERIPFKLEEIVEEVASINAVAARQKGIELRTEMHNAPNCLLVGDPLRIKQVLLNLVGNAVKFTQHGNVTIGVDCKTGNETAEIEIAISDTGIGIERDKQESIFHQFIQADSSISRTHGGTGLGLSLCRMLMQLMKGSLELTSQPGAGSRFTIKLSLPVEHGSQVAEKAPEAPADDKPGAARILLVEDNKANILVASCLLDINGYAYEVARNGKEALLKLSQPHRFDAVLMDVQMPEMDGLEVTGHLRSREKAAGLPRVPVIGMTAHAFSGDRQRCLDAGMDDYLSKPFIPEDLVAILARHTQEKEPENKASNNEGIAA